MSPGPKAVPVGERLLSKLSFSGSGCWIFEGTKDRKGYGYLNILGKTHLTHRIAYEQWVGKIEDGLQIDHLCRVTSCCNPSHLEAVTPQVNTLRGFSPAALCAKVTHCSQGHEYNEENTYHNPSGSRECRTCKRASRNRE